MSDSCIRWGVLGASNIAGDFILAMNTLPKDEHKVIAVGSSSEERAKVFAEKNGIHKWYGCHELLVQDPEVQIVYIAGNTNTHAKLCKLALNNGKPVLCEKAFALNFKEAKEVLDLANEKGLFIMEAMWTRFLPATLYLEKILEEKKIGEVSIALATFGAAMETKQRIYDKALGGSVLLDIGIYTLTFADIVFRGERPVKIVASGHLFDSGVDHSVSVTLMFSGKRMAQLLFTAGVALQNKASVFGTKGSTSLEAPFHAATMVTTVDTIEFPLPDLERPSKCINSAGLRYEIDAVRQSILSGELENKVMPHSTTLRIMEYVDEIALQLGMKL